MGLFREVDMSPQAVAESTRADLRNAYAEAQGPFTVSDEQGDFIVMRASDYDGEPPLTEGEIRVLEKGYAQALRGETRDAFESLAEIRAIYGL